MKKEKKSKQDSVQNKKSKQQQKAEAKMVAKVLAQRESFQEFLPIKDIKNGCFIDDSGYLYPVIVLGSINPDLMSKDQIASFARGAEIAFSSLNCKRYQCLLVPMPYDISVWQKHNDNIIDEILSQKAELQASSSGDVGSFAELDEIRRKSKQLDIKQQLLKDTSEYVVDKLHSGRMTTKKAYLIPDFEVVDDIRVVIENARETVKRFQNNGIDCWFATEQELRDLLFILFNPLSAEINRTPRSSATPNLVSDSEKE